MPEPLLLLPPPPLIGRGGQPDPHRAKPPTTPPYTPLHPTPPDRRPPLLAFPPAFAAGLSRPPRPWSRRLC